MKRFSLFLASAAAVFGYGQDFSKKVTFQCLATPADQVLRQLTKASGLSMTPTPSMAPEILLISVKDAPIGELMNKIASVTDGQWTNEGGSFTLEPNQNARNAEEQTDLKAVESQITQMFHDLQSRNLPPGPLTLLAEQDLSLVARVESGERIVFSTAPTGDQYAINGVNEQFVSSVFSRSGANAGVAQPNGQGADAQDQVQPAKVDLAVSDLDDTLNVRLVGYDDEGHEILAQAEDLSVHRTPQATPVPDALKKADSDKVVVSKLTQAVESEGFDSFTAQVKDFDSDTMDALLHPDKHDPLSFFASDALTQRAAECGEQLVADIPDSVVAERSETAKGYLDEECARGNFLAKEDKGWILISPGDPPRSRSMRANRPALATLVQEAHRKSDACLTDMAIFAISEGHPPLGPNGDVADASTPYLRLFIPEWRDFTASENRFDLLRLYGFLSTDEKQALLNSKPIPISDLSEQARTALNAVAFGAYARYRVQPPPPARNQQPRERVVFPGVIVPNQTQNPRRRLNPRAFFGQASYLAEPTEAFGNGIPSEGYIQLSMNSTRPASNGLGGLNRFAFEFHLTPEIWFEQAIEEPQGGP